jgi:hypothetical protein
VRAWLARVAAQRDHVAMDFNPVQVSAVQ